MTPSRAVATGLALAVASGVLTGLADYPRPVPLLAWVAASPVLVAALRRGPRDALWLGAIWGSVASLEPARDFLRVIPVPMVAAMMAGRVALMAVTLALTTVIARRRSPAHAGWVFAALVVLGEWAGEASGLGLWLTVASGQASVGWLRAASAVGGPYLVSFVVALVNGTVAVLVTGPGRARLSAAVSAMLMIGGAALAGALTVPTPARTARVAAVVAGLPDDMLDRWDRRQVRSDETWQALTAYEALTRRAASAGAVVVVWPEYGVFVREVDFPQWRDRVTALAHTTGAVIVAGYIDVDRGWNRALLAAPNGDAKVYSKQALVPGAEDSWQHPGPEPFAEVRGQGLRVATRICYDMDFTGGSRAAGRARVDLLAVPARDWPGIEERHAMQSVFRAAENGVAMVRADRAGWSLLVDPSGRVLARESSVGRREVLLVGELPIARAGTAYSWAGDWLVAIAVLGLLGVVGVSLRASRGAGREPASALDRA